MATDKNKINNLQHVFKNIPGIKSVKKIKIKNNMIESICIEKEILGKLFIQKLYIKDSSALFNFYFKGLSEKSRNFFPPYPLFSPLPSSINDLFSKIKEWKKENDWTVLKLNKGKKIIGICLLKRFFTKKPRSGLAIHEKFQNKGLGTILQTIVNEQGRLLNLKKIYISIAKDNLISQRMHEKCGFKKTNKLVPHFIYQNNKKKIDRYDIEMVKKIK